MPAPIKQKRKNLSRKRSKTAQVEKKKGKGGQSKQSEEHSLVSGIIVTFVILCNRGNISLCIVTPWMGAKI
jgi:hypothetical protein